MPIHASRACAILIFALLSVAAAPPAVAATHTVTNLGDVQLFDTFYCGALDNRCATTASSIFYGTPGDVFDFGYFQPEFYTDPRTSACGIPLAPCHGLAGYARPIFIQAGGTGLSQGLLPIALSCNGGPCAAPSIAALLFTLPENFAGIQLALVEPGIWIAPVPLPAAFPLFLSFLTVMGWFSVRAEHREQSGPDRLAAVRSAR